MASTGLQVVTVCGADRDKLLGTGQHVDRGFLLGCWLRRASRGGVEIGGTQLSEIDYYSAKWGLKGRATRNVVGGPGFTQLAA